MFPHERYATLLYLLALAESLAMADFTLTFDRIGSGDSIALAWARVKPELFPLYIEARMYNRTEEDSVVMFETNLTS